MKLLIDLCMHIMLKPIRCFLLLFSTATSLFAAQKDTTSNKTLLVKTNILNFIMYPSIHLEQEINPKNSLQFNFHRGGITFISRQDWLNTSLQWRHYFSKKATVLRGFYSGLGLHLNHDFNGFGADSIGKNPTGETNLGILPSIGYQKRIKASRFYWDFGTGLALSIINLQNNNYPNSPELRLNISLVFRL